MAAITVTNSVDSLRTIFNRIHSVGYLTEPTLPAAVDTIDYWLPILEGSVTFDTGQPDITEVKLTTGAKWTTMTEAGDSEISMQCSTFNSSICDLFLTKKITATTLGTTGDTLDGSTYSGNGYSLESKKVTGAMILLDESKKNLIFLPNVEIFASVGIEEENPGYFTLQITPLAHGDSGAAIYFMEAGED